MDNLTLIFLVFGPLGLAACGLWATDFSLIENFSLLDCHPLTLLLCQLTWLITHLSLLLCVPREKTHDSLWVGSILTNELVHLAVFSTRDLLGFFILFEMALIPLSLIISRQGSGNGRLRASLLFFCYTLGSSIPILIGTLFLLSFSGTLLSGGTQVLTALSLEAPFACFVWISFGLSFAVKTPLYPFIVWLVHAHTEAPLEGSILLAGVVLKLATFGVSLILLNLVWKTSLTILPYSMSICNTTLLIASIALTQQIDLKSFVALSSVAHIAMGTLGILALNEIGVVGSWLLAVAHGLVSPGLFIVAGGVIYVNFGTRLIYPQRGGSLLMPLTSSLFFACTLANIAMPLSANWVAEVLILMGLILTVVSTAVIAGTSIVFSALYSIWLLNRVTRGTWSPYLRVTGEGSLLEIFALILLLALILGGGCLSSGILITLQLRDDRPARTDAFFLGLFPVLPTSRRVGFLLS